MIHADPLLTTLLLIPMIHADPLLTTLLPLAGQLFKILHGQRSTHQLQIFFCLFHLWFEGLKCTLHPVQCLPLHLQLLKLFPSEHREAELLLHSTDSLPDPGHLVSELSRHCSVHQSLPRVGTLAHLPPAHRAALLPGLLPPLVQAGQGGLLTLESICSRREVSKSASPREGLVDR